jgi:3-oxoacyl-[acyl-carrier protein] reductase
MPNPIVPPAAPSPVSDAAHRPTVLVTGGSRGIGRAVCLEFGRAGWRVGVHYLTRRQEADGTAALINQAGGEAIPYCADIRKAAQVQAMVRDFVARWGRLDVLICNAGQAASGLAVRLRPDQWSALIDTNLTGTFHCLQAAGTVMQNQRDGSIIVMASYAGLQGRPGQAAYAASKAGLLGLVKTAAREWGSHNIRINAICPGWHRTDLSGIALPDPAEEEGPSDHLLGRFVDLNEVARSIYHLALLQDISGQIWNLDSRIL